MEVFAIYRGSFHPNSAMMSTKALEPVNTMYGKKVAIRRKIEEAGIPYTYISSNAFAGYSLSNLVQFGKPSPPRDKVTIYGSGDAKGEVLNFHAYALHTFISTSSTN